MTIKKCDYNRANLVLVRVNECGEEDYWGWWEVSCDDEEDEETLEIWKDHTINKAYREKREERGFYWEDRRGWTSHYFGGWFY